MYVDFYVVFEVGVGDGVWWLCDQFVVVDVYILVQYVVLVWVGYVFVEDCYCYWNQCWVCDLGVVVVGVDFVQFVGVYVGYCLFVGSGIVVDWNLCGYVFYCMCVMVVVGLDQQF